MLEQKIVAAFIQEGVRPDRDVVALLGSQNVITLCTSEQIASQKPDVVIACLDRHAVMQNQVHLESATQVARTFSIPLVVYINMVLEIQDVQKLRKEYQIPEEAEITSTYKGTVGLVETLKTALGRD